MPSRSKDTFAKFACVIHPDAPEFEKFSAWELILDTLEDSGCLLDLSWIDLSCQNELRSFLLLFSLVKNRDAKLLWRVR